MLKALVQRYEDECKEHRLPKEGWEKRNVHFALIIGREGGLLQVVSLMQEVERGKKKILRPQELLVPMGETRTSGIYPLFLCDNSSYFLGADTKGKPKRSADCFTAAAKLHEEILADVTGETAQALVHFFHHWQIGKNAVCKHPEIAPYADEILAGANLVFRYAGQYVHEAPEIASAWERYRQNRAEEKRGRCLVTGTIEPIAIKHPALKGVSGAQPTGAMLVSFNENAYESYGHDGQQGGNAPVSKHAAFAYGTALNALLADDAHKKLIGDTTVVYWAAEKSEAAQNVFAGALGDNNEMTDDLLDKILTDIRDGGDIDYDGVSISYENPFYILGLAPNAARVSIRFFLQDSFGVFLKNLALYREQMDIIRPSWVKSRNVPLGKLLLETVNPNAKKLMAAPVMAGAMMRAVLTGMPYPVSVFQNIMIRIRAQQGAEKINPRRAGFLKAYLLRNRERGIAVALDENETDTAYLLGRWFAVLEQAQKVALPEIKETIRDRFFNSACATPAYVFPLLQKLSLHHIKKLEKSADRVRVEKFLAEILGKLEVGSIPRHLPLEEQGIFILGYYHQQQQWYQKKEAE